MSFALRIDSAPRALHRRLVVALAIFALGASVCALVFAEPAQRGVLALAALGCAAVAWGRQRLARGAEPAEGSLHIDEAGRASWIDSRARPLAPRPVRIERWNVLGPYAWLRLRAQDEPKTIDVTFARLRRAGDTGDDWRRLRAWLLWYGRGTTPAAGRSVPASTRQ
ncbi:MAG: hypothetical protein LT102_05490 [Burkholderiaceae bacterium]|nr:hypothetical protein [Burkholderiaceae bacterium]